MEINSNRDGQGKGDYFRQKKWYENSHTDVNA